MNAFRGLQRFLVPSKKADAHSQDANNVLNQKRQQKRVKQEKPKTEEGPSPAARRRSIFRPLSTTFRKDKTKGQPDAPTQKGKPEKSPRDETIQQLLHDIGRLSENNTRLKEEVNAKEVELEKLKTQGGESKWKDGLYEQRMKEHASAQTSIKTGSTPGMDLSKLVRQLNDEIAAVATVATKSPATDPGRGGLDSIPKLLGEKFLIPFSHSDNRLEEGLARALLQIFLVQRCRAFIQSWCLGYPEFDGIFNEFYDRISNKEEQRVAGKWRQITFEQLPHRLDRNSLQTEVVSTLIEIASCAGWKGCVQEVSPLVDSLFKSVERLRKVVKEDVISADIQPWVAVPGAKFDSAVMKNVGDDFSLLQVAEPTRCIVLGCTGLGLITQLPAGEKYLEVKNAHSRARVVLVESLGVGQSYASKL